MVKVLAAVLFVAVLGSALALEKTPLQPAEQVIVVNDQESWECEVCVKAMDKVFELLNGATIAAEIEAALNKVCGLLPVAYKETCKTEVDKVFEEIVSIIEEVATPRIVCEVTRWCGGVECSVCEAVVKEVMAQISDKRTEEEIEKYLDKVCDELPGYYKVFCDALLNHYFEELVQYIHNDPDKVCDLVRMC